MGNQGGRHRGGSLSSVIATHRSGISDGQCFHSGAGRVRSGIFDSRDFEQKTLLLGRNRAMDNTQRISTVSRRLRLACSGLIYFLPLACALFWIFFNYLYAREPLIPLPVRVEHDLPGLTRFLGFLVDLIPMAATLYGLRRLRDLFHLYENGLIFTELNVRSFRSLGRTLIVWVACSVARNSLLSIVLTLNNPPGRRVITLGLSSADFSGVFVGIVVVTISWVMDEARKITEDQALII
jgi:hypothetical protein